MGAHEAGLLKSKLFVDLVFVLVAVLRIKQLIKNMNEKFLGSAEPVGADYFC